MRDDECVLFLQRVLPRLQMQWPGFRKVRGQVCKRINRRITELGIDSVADYSDYLDSHQEEWRVLDSLCQVTISRFYRDKLVYQFLAQEVLPALAQQALDRGRGCLSVWSAGCSSGEEPYTIALIWHLQLQAIYPDLRLRLVASDANPAMRRRMTDACYAYSSIKNLPADWRGTAFTQQEELYCLKPEYRGEVQFRLEDVRQSMPDETFDLVLCRNLVFTYFEKRLQGKVLAQIRQILRPDGALVIGIHERLPEGAVGFSEWSTRFRIYRRITADNE